jgi:hypothetical protein
MNAFDLASNLARSLLTQVQSEKVLTQDDIRDAVQKVQRSGMVNPVLSADDESRLIRDLEGHYQTIIGAERDLLGRDDDGWEPWLDEKQAKLQWHYSARYTEFLRQKSFNDNVLKRLDASTDRILGYLGDPDHPGPWDRRGLVVGLVQSGKTANYIGLINKAVDAGYKVIIVLTGFTDSLRTQTQIRIEEGVLGYSMAADDTRAGRFKRPACGVGLLPVATATKVDSVTTRDYDFSTAIAKNLGVHIGGNPIVFAVKKNTSVLRNLIQWVRDFGDTPGQSGNYVSNSPLLVIDDESDVGSVDTKKGAVDSLGDPDVDHDPTKINKQIRKLLSLFDKSGYVGYTATPFANVLIHDSAAAGVDPEDQLAIGDDLFPRSFIVSLPTPSNHVGPSVVFGRDDTDGLPILRTVDDVDVAADPRQHWIPAGHKKGHIPRHNGDRRIPPSLRRAILSFLLAGAARSLRGQRTESNSMLVHVTRYTDVQDEVARQIERELSGIVDRLSNGVAAEVLLTEFRDLWETDTDSFAATTDRIREMDRDSTLHKNPSHSWSKVRRELPRFAESVAVREIHGTSGKELDYSSHSGGLNVIAIGGDKLSRGLTLEGLTTSYFLRASKMYDTLMQMGRWFGYRPGYLDLCRLYTTAEMATWFGHIAEATEELREEFARMSISKRTPKEYGLRIRSHPQLMVTSSVKMRHGTKLYVTFDGDIVETIDFRRDSEAVRSNLNAGKQLISAIGRNPRATKYDAEDLSGRAVGWHTVPPELVLEFLSRYQEHPAARKVKTRLLHEYIEKELRSGRLSRWIVLMASGEARNTYTFSDNELQLVKRSWYFGRSLSDSELEEHRARLIRENHFRIRRLVSPSDERVGLSQDRLKMALDADVEKWRSGGKSGKKPRVPSGSSIRSVRDTAEGLLLLYPLDGSDDCSECPEIPTLGFAISFPEVVEGGSQVEYVVNNIYEQELRSDE